MSRLLTLLGLLTLAGTLLVGCAPREAEAPAPPPNTGGAQPNTSGTPSGSTNLELRR